MASSSESSSRRNMDTPEEPVTTNFFHRHAVVSLDVVVVGGSIDGLAAAYNLKQAGHRVRVFEKLGTKGGSPESNKLHKVKGCMRVSPNMMKCLQQWGLKSRLMKCAIKCTKIHFLEGVCMFSSSQHHYPRLILRLRLGWRLPRRFDLARRIDEGTRRGRSRDACTSANSIAWYQTARVAASSFFTLS